MILESCVIIAHVMGFRSIYRVVQGVKGVAFCSQLPKGSEGELLLNRNLSEEGLC